MTKRSLSPDVKNAVAEFMEYTPVNRLSRNLRNVLLYYIIYEQDALPLEMEDILCDLLNLFRLLDVMEGE